MTAQLREQQATAGDWLADYAALVLLRDAEGALLEHDPELLLLAANATYRSTHAGLDRQDRQGTVRRLEPA